MTDQQTCSGENISFFAKPDLSRLATSDFSRSKLETFSCASLISSTWVQLKSLSRENICYWKTGFMRCLHMKAGLARSARQPVEQDGWDLCFIWNKIYINRPLLFGFNCSPASVVGLVPFSFSAFSIKPTKWFAFLQFTINVPWQPTQQFTYLL